MQHRGSWRRAGLIVGIGLVLAAAGCRTIASRNPAAARADLFFGPFVSAVTSDGAQVHWITASAKAGAFRLAEGAPDARIERSSTPMAGRAEFRHTAILRGLTPDRRHRYEVGAGRAAAAGSFRTPPAGSPRRPFRFVITGDTQGYPLRIRFGAEALAKEDPDFIVHTGDFCNRTGDFALLDAEFFDPWRELLRRAPVWPTRGNHEYGIEPYASLFALSAAQPWYSFSYDNLHVVVLDQWNLGGSEKMEPERMAAMAEWLDADLAAAKGRADWIIVAGHQQMFNVAGHGSTWGHEHILPLLYKHGVDLVVSGHSHLYERFVPIGPAGAKPIHFIVSGGGGGPNYPSVPSPILVRSFAAPHYCLYRIEGDRLDLAVKGPDGSLVDRFSLFKSGGALPPAVTAAAIGPDEAMRLLKLYSGFAANTMEFPAAGRAWTGTLAPRRFPPGSRVTISSDPSGAWSITEQVFEVPETPEAPAGSDAQPPAPPADIGEPAPVESWRLVAVPPPGVRLDGGGFSPPLTASIRLEYRGRTWVNASVPIGLHEMSVQRLAPPPEPVRIAPAPRVFALDGDLADWAAVPFLPSATGAGRRMKLAWTPDALYGAVAVRRDSLDTNDGIPWNGDSLEVSFEADALRRGRAPPRGEPVKFVLWPSAAGDGPASYRRVFGQLPGGSVQSAWRRTPEGYALEFRVSARAFAPPAAVGAPAAPAAPAAGAPPLEAGRRIGFDLVLRGDGRILEQLADTANVQTTWGHPVFWSLIRLDAE